MAREYKDVKGLDLIHLFNEVWRVGKLNRLKGTNKVHTVIYGPDDKEYHVYNQDAQNLRTKVYGYYDEPAIQTERCDRAKAKIYILTHILDEKENWTGLNLKPEVGTIIKVIYNNGTIKVLEFSGEWETTTIERLMYPTDPNQTDRHNPTTITPVCWRYK